MGRSSTLVDWLSEIEILEWLRSAQTKPEYQKRLAVWLTAFKRFAAREIAEMLGVSTQAIWLWLGQYNHQGPDGLQRQGRGGRRWSFLTLEQESKLLEDLVQQAEQGKVLTAKQIHQKACDAAKRKVSIGYVYKLLHRHEWRKLGPRPRHVKADKAAQEAFKKTSRRQSKKQ